MSPDDPAYIILSVSRALWGEIWPSYRAVMCRVRSNSAINIEYVVDGEIQSGMLESVSLVETSVLADFDENVEVASTLLRLDAPTPVQVENALIVYLRKEF
ncbi:hypothetical protein SAMN02800692_3734 [Luteibacter sp. UNC138MFCol5.1]|uniref:hypothetical protein n=1 Tax=Luteibacter sp. UNC138MFCol5.1 TaxID=1502774 RepID=UPI0008AC0D37|nr:hypothetical protein [Luteibacter sp. UNC138MFCol5.1]SEP10929.1 hypothetical protein SAMN02800692_3734 [Luteibacter sp. UNC138MFCol5.1]